MAPDFLPALSRALVIAAFGGAGLVLTQVYSRRGPLVFPVYAALLAALALSLARAPALGFSPRFLIALSATGVATAIAFVATLVLAARARRTLERGRREPAPGRAPRWGLPLVVLLLVAASAGVAYVSS
jgi:hypothetical protein